MGGVVLVYMFWENLKLANEEGLNGFSNRSYEGQSAQCLRPTPNLDNYEICKPPNPLLCWSEFPGFGTTNEH